MASLTQPEVFPTGPWGGSQSHQVNPIPISLCTHSEVVEVFTGWLGPCVFSTC